MSTSHALAAVLAAATLAAPTAATARPPDMHASTATAAATTPSPQPNQDLRSPDARDTAAHPRRLSHTTAVDSTIYAHGVGQRLGVQPPQLAPVDEPSAAGSGSPTHGPLPGPPTWPAHPQPISAAHAAKASDGDNAIDWTTIGLGTAASLLAVSGIAALANRRNRRQRALRATH
jgi:hypothetical protein